MVIYCQIFVKSINTCKRCQILTVIDLFNKETIIDKFYGKKLLMI